MSPEAQKQLAELDQTIRDKHKALQALLRETTDHKPLADYTFRTLDGDVPLSALFGDKDDLIVIHNMGASCAYCTLWADGFNGMLPHFESRAAFVVVSPDAPEAQQRFAEGRGWRFRMVSDADAAFTTDMGYRYGEGDKTMVMPGFSTFHRDAEESIRRVAHAPFGPGDVFCGIWPMFDLLEAGAGGWQPRFRYDG